MTAPRSLPVEASTLQASARWLVGAQLPSGMIPLVSGGGADPWNHVEAAIALDVAGYHAQARSAYCWLTSMQRSDGAWYAAYGPNGEVDARHVDTNAVGYLATGIYAHGLLSGSFADVAEFFPIVAAGLDFVCSAELVNGLVSWSIDEHGATSPHSLVAGSSSLVSSLRHGASLAAELGMYRPDWERVAERIAGALQLGHPRFFDKREFAMDWYYPVLTGALEGESARDRLAHGAPEFVTDYGVLCRSDRRWVTTAETAETVIAAWRAGETSLAEQLFSTLFDKRRSSGGYLTGLVYPERSEFPPGEETTYSCAAVLLAANVLGGGVASRFFGDGAVHAGQGFSTAMSSLKLSVGESADSMKRPDAIAS